MKIGLITDVHSNLTALDAVLARMADCSAILCAGDIIGIGPHPEAVVQRLMRLPNLTAVTGNHDRYLLEGMPDSVPNDEGMGESEMDMHRWEHSCLSAASAAFLRTLPCRADISAGGLRIALMHYCMDERRRYVSFTPAPADEDLARMFAGEDADIIVYGHDHAPCIRHANGRWYVNPGALGCPGAERHIARAAVLTLSGGSASVEALSVPYDAAQPVSDIRALTHAARDEVLKYFYGIG